MTVQTLYAVPSYLVGKAFILGAAGIGPVSDVSLVALRVRR
jgi:hypothetical protein